MAVRLQPVGYDQLEGWYGDDHVCALNVFLKTFRANPTGKFKTGKLGISHRALAAIAESAEKTAPFDPQSARNFLESRFTPHKIIVDEKAPSKFDGFVTAYFEPEVNASRVKTGLFNTPLYARPADLVDVTEKNRPAGFDPEFRYGRMPDENGNSVIVEYPDRAAIERGYLDGQGLEIAWVAGRAEALFIHIQGSARLRFPDGTTVRVGYAAKSGHPYTAVGSVLLRNGALQPQNCGMAAIRRWFRDNPQETGNIIDQNRSFIFFREYPIVDSDDGPVGAANTGLTPGRSLAVDRMLHTFATPVWIETRDPLPGEQRRFNHLMIAQDTGSAIIGPSRGDLFLGSGTKAGKIAGEVKHAARFTVLVPGRNK